jgi:putative PIN family toxin of toxin-antitoxin system
VRIVLDTNVIVSALLSERGAPAQILDLCIAGEIDLVVDARIVAEYEDVLARREFAFDGKAIADLVAFLQFAEYVVGVPLPVSLPDPDDLPFLEVAAAGAVDALVTGNVKHFRTRGGKIDVPILAPRALLDLLAGG